MSPVPSIRLTLCLAAAFILVSCSAPPNTAAPAAPGEPTATSEPASAAVSSEFPAEPHPIHASVSLDSDRSVRAIIPISGGSLEATAADGTVFTLVVPANALLVDAEIVMTPLSSLEGTPFDGALAAVELEPEGIRLFEPAILTIAPSFQIPPGEEASFAFYSGGEDFHLYPLLPDPQTLSFPIIHFSGYGVGQATRIQQTTVAHSPPSSIEAQLNGQLARDLARARNQALSGQDGEPVDFEAYLQKFFDQVIQPSLQAARTDCEAAKTAIPKAMGWARQVVLLGYGDHFAAQVEEVWKASVDALVNCYNQASEKCVDDHEPGQATVMLSILRPLGLIGQLDRVDLAKIAKCLTFELRFDSRFEGTPPSIVAGSRYVGQSVQHVLATVRFSLDIETGFSITNPTAPLDFAEFTTGVTVPSPCTMEETAVGSVFKIVKLLMPINGSEAADPPRDITLLIEPGTTGESAHVSCPGVGGSVGDVIPPAPRWHETWAVYHAREEFGQGTYAIRDWNVTGGELLATKLFESQTPSVGGSQFTEETTLELHHTPEP